MSFLQQIWIYVERFVEIKWKLSFLFIVGLQIRSNNKYFNLITFLCVWERESEIPAVLLQCEMKKCPSDTSPWRGHTKLRWRENKPIKTLLSSILVQINPKTTMTHLSHSSNCQTQVLEELLATALRHQKFCLGSKQPITGREKQK